MSSSRFPSRRLPPRHHCRDGAAGGRQAVISKFFIDRPVFASVLSIVIVLAGLVAMRVLPISQYPQIVPPEVVISATYPGATAENIAATVAAPLEQQINGVERMIYMQSTSTGSGTMNLTVTFEIGTNPDQNAINVNNRVQRALAAAAGGSQPARGWSCRSARPRSCRC